MSPLLRFISYDLELIAYVLFCVFLIFHCFYDRRQTIKVIAAYYFLASLLLIKATHFITNGSNIAIYSLLYLITSFFLGVYFFYTLHASWKKVIVIALCVVEAVYYYFSTVLYPDPMFVFDSTGYVILSTAVMVMVFLYMHQILTNVKEEKLSLNFDFWFVSSQMVYHFGSFVIFLTFSYLTKKIMPADYSDENRTLLIKIWGIHNVLVFLSALLTGGSIVWIAFHRKSSSSS